MIDELATPKSHPRWHARVTITRMKKILGWALLILLIFYIGTNPGPAADIAKSLGDGVENIFRNIGTFFSELAH
jgi:hypothetical protein